MNFGGRIYLWNHHYNQDGEHFHHPQRPLLLFAVHLSVSAPDNQGSALDLFTFYFLFYILFFLSFLGLHPRNMEVPRLGVESELLLLTYATATASWDPSWVCDLHHSSQQCWILNPLSEARDWTCNLMVPSHIHLPLRHDRNSYSPCFYWYLSGLGLLWIKLLWTLLCRSLCGFPLGEISSGVVPGMEGRCNFNFWRNS